MSVVFIAFKLMVLMRWFGVFSPVFVVSNVLLIASPPALTLAQVCRFWISVVWMCMLTYHMYF